MKQLTIITALLLSSISLFAQNFEGIVSHIEKSEWSSIEPMLEDLVDYCFNDDQDLLEKAEFISKMKEALAVVKPSSSEIIHVVDSKKSAAKYVVAKLKGEGGDEYRMFVYTEGEKIIEIRINKE